MKNLKKLMALVTALTLAFSLNITSFAAEETTTEHKRPVSSTEITLDADNAVTVTLGDTQAKFYRDTNEDGEQESQVYIRAQFAGETEYDLMKTVTIETALPVTSSELEFAQNGNVYTAADVDLYNKSYTVTIGGTDCILAAGLPSGTLAVDSDVLGVESVTLNGTGTTISVTNVENPFEGNLYYVEKELGDWTSIQGTVAATGKVSFSNRDAVSGTITLADETATVGGCATGTGSAYTFDLSANIPEFTVEKDGVERSYVISASYDGYMKVTYQINLKEVMTSDYYKDTVKASADEIIAAGKEYFGMTGNVADLQQVGGTIQVPEGCDAMTPMIQFCTWAENNNKFSGTTSNSGTYLSKLDGLGEFSCGSSSGWMYMDGEYSEKCTGPNVGAASYTMTDGQVITWYMTTNYFNHF